MKQVFSKEPSKEGGEEECRHRVQLLGGSLVSEVGSFSLNEKEKERLVQ